MTDTQEIHDKVKGFILREFLDREDPSALGPTTQLFTTGIFDSIATLKLVAFLEKEFDISIEAHEADARNLDTLDDITRLVASKQLAGRAHPPSGDLPWRCTTSLSVPPPGIRIASPFASRPERRCPIVSWRPFRIACATAWR